MKTSIVLKNVFRLIFEEIENNDEFSKKINDVLSQSDKSGDDTTHQFKDEKSDRGGIDSHVKKRPSNRRSPALLDPVQIARQSEDELRTQLSSLSIDQLYDVVAEYGMDTSKLVMKWKDKDRIIDRVVEVSTARASKGHAFRAEQPDLTRDISGGTSDEDSAGADGKMELK